VPVDHSIAGAGRDGDGALDDFMRAVPKAELHLHIEGTLEPELMLELGARNGVSAPYASVEEARAAYDFSDLRSFLNLYYRGMHVLVHERDFYDLTAAYLRRAHADGARHVEVFFDPQSHLVRGVPFADVVGGIGRALQEAERELGLSARLIMCFLRDQSPGSALEVLQLALPYRDLIAGVGLDSAEIGHPPREFATVFARAREEGFAAVAHAGEEGPAEYVSEALDVLRVQRIDHGVRAAEDPELVARLARDRIPLTMCPLSNVKLGVVASLSQHPLKRLLDAGVAVTVNSDDPAYFGGYLVDNYRAAQRALALTRDDIVQLARNSITASLLPDDRKLELLRDIELAAA
jgi:adenosine deaminase